MLEINRIIHQVNRSRKSRNNGCQYRNCEFSSFFDNSSGVNLANIDGKSGAGKPIHSIFLVQRF